MTLFHGMLLFFSALMGGILNSVAGGGSFFTFPVLIFSGISSVAANATSTIALWSGSLASMSAYRKQFEFNTRLIIILVILSIIGGVAGALTLLFIPAYIFDHFLPFLILVATLIFAFGKKLKNVLSIPPDSIPDVHSKKSIIILSLVQLIISFYGGFFGGGIGILMLATLGLMGIFDMHQMNAVKVLLACIINGAAVVTFLFSNLVQWPSAMVMLLGAVLGGYAGAKYAQKINPTLVRGFVIICGSCLTVYFFLRLY